MKQSIFKHRLAIMGILIGACGGYLYYHFIGCASGTCLITSRPLNSTLYGSVMGWLIFSSFKKNETDSEQNKIESNEH